MSQKAVKKLRREIRRRLDAERKLLDVGEAVKPLLDAVEELRPKMNILGLSVFTTSDVEKFYEKVATWVKKSSTPSK